jgi:hypothetical protein
MKKAFAFSLLTGIAGFAAGIVIAPQWRSVSKRAIKAGIKGGRKLKEVSLRAKENFEDVTAEAVEELAHEEQPSAGPSVN